MTGFIPRQRLHSTMRCTSARWWHCLRVTWHYLCVTWHCLRIFLQVPKLNRVKMSEVSVHVPNRVSVPVRECTRESLIYVCVCVNVCVCVCVCLCVCVFVCVTNLALTCMQHIHACTHGGWMSVLHLYACEALMGARAQEAGFFQSAKPCDKASRCDACMRGNAYKDTVYWHARTCVQVAKHKSKDDCWSVFR